MVLTPVSTPRHWVARWAVPGPDDDGTWAGPADLTAERLAVLHAQSVGRGATGAAAAKWLCSWFAGGVAAAVGLTLCLQRAALLDPVPAWRLHPAGWPDRLALDVPGTAVAPGHPWVGRAGVRVLADDAAVRAAALQAVLDVAAPVVSTCHGLARVGRGALWAEVGDALGLAVTRCPEVPASTGAVRELAAVVRLPGAPWPVLPVLEVVAGADGPVYRAVKGGCCLAWRSRPVAGAAPQRCATCPLRAGRGG